MKTVISQTIIPLLVLFVALFSGSHVGAEVHLQSGFFPPVEEATLFAFDDRAIPLTENLRLEMNPPRKHPDNPVVPLGKDGEPDHWSVQFYGSVIRHEGKFKMWYVAADKKALADFKPGGPFKNWRPAYAESKDGIHWTKPNLGFVEYNGNSDNNLLLIQPEQAQGLHLIVIHEPDEADPGKRFKMILTMRSYLHGKKISTSMPLFSPDGFRWKVPESIVIENYAVKEESLALPPEHFEQGGLFKWNGMYHLPGQQLYPWASRPDGETAGRVMTVLRSWDFLDWSAAKSLGFYRARAAEPTIINGEGEEAHLAASVWNRGNVLIGLYGLWHGGKSNPERTIDLGFMVSNDGLHFREPVRDFVFIPRGQDGTWDEGGLLQGQGFENVGDKTFIYYGHWDPRLLKYKPRGGVGLATLPRDRFGALAVKHPDKPAGFLTSVISTSGAPEIWINASGLSRLTRLKIELFDVVEQPIAGWSGDHAAIVDRAGLRIPVTWPKTVTSFTADSFHIKVSIEGKERHKARVFALYVR